MLKVKGIFLALAITMLSGAANATLNSNDYVCKALWPASSSSNEICAVSKATGQCTFSWAFRNKGADTSSEKQAMQNCEHFLNPEMGNTFDRSQHHCGVWPAAFDNQICAISNITGQGGMCWQYSKDDLVAKAAAMKRCDRFLNPSVEKVITEATHYCRLVWPETSTSNEVCAASKANGQCTVSWSFKNDNATKSKQKDAFASCLRYLNR